MSERPSALRVFGKSLRVLAIGWALAVTWLWTAEIRQHVRRHDILPPDYALATFATGTLAALVLEGLAVIWTRWTGPAETRSLQRREWHHAFWWALFPNAMLLYAAYVMIFGVD
jgi:hypothetical protein